MNEIDDAAQFDEARGHHGEVGHHVVAAEKGVEGLHHVEDFAGLLGDGPAPARKGWVLFLEEGVVVLCEVEGRAFAATKRLRPRRRVEIDEVHGLVFQVAAEDVEVVAVVERAHAGRVSVCRRPAK